MSYLVLARKWRPQNFGELVGQEAIARILQNAIVNGKVAHAYIFSGPRGVGKTTTARILAKALNCEQGPTSEPCGSCASCQAVTDGSSMDVSEIDGASNTGIDNIRDLRERIRYASSGGRYRVYIIDEAHMLSTAAFNGLLKTLEEPPAHVIFVLATTEPRRIPATVLSRCQHLPFRRVSTQKIKERLRFISDAEKIGISDSALDMIARAGEGSIRDALTILDQAASFAEKIGSTEIQDLLGVTDLQTLASLTSSVIEGDRKEILHTIAGLADSGADLRAFTKDLAHFVRNLLITSILGKAEGFLDVSDEEAEVVSRLKETTTEEHLALLLSELIRAEPSIKNALHPRVALEMSLIRLSLLSHFSTIDAALRNLKHQTGQETEDAPSAGSVQRPKGKGPKQKAEPSSAAVDREVRDIAAPEEPRPVPTGSLEDLWGAALERIEKTHHPLACKLREGTVSFEQDAIRIVFNGGLSVHAESVKENAGEIAQVMRELAGRKVPIKVETAKGKTVSRRDLKEKALKDPIVKEALELFEGRIVDVIPAQERGQE